MAEYKTGKHGYSEHLMEKEILAPNLETTVNKQPENNLAARTPGCDIYQTKHKRQTFHYVTPYPLGKEDGAAPTNAQFEGLTLERVMCFGNYFML